MSAAETSPFALAEASATRLAERSGVDSHDLAVVLGSGWAPVADALGPPRAEIPADSLEGFAPPGVTGHPGVVRSVPVAGAEVLVFVGRVHAYEGHPLATVVHAVRTAVLAGCRAVVLTNAAGAVNPDYRVGQPVLIADQLNLTGSSPLAGPIPPVPYPSRFTDLVDLYSARARAAVSAVVPGLAEGIYAGLAGPHYETPAEVRMLRTLGADLVGMSTVHEAIAARHLGADVLGISLVTNAAAGVAPGGLDHQDVVAAGQAAAPVMGQLLLASVRAVLTIVRP